MPQNEARHAGERQQDPEREAEGLGEQRVGIGADRVEGDIAEVEQAGEADHDVQAPAEHHVDQNLDAEIVDPFHRAAEAGERDDDHRIGDDEADGEGDEPFADERCARPDGAAGDRPQRALLEPRLEAERIGEAADADDGDDGEQQRPARRQDQVVADVGDGLEADQRQEQAEGESAVTPASRSAWRHRCAGSGAAAGHLTPSRHPAGRTGPAAGRSR